MDVKAAEGRTGEGTVSELKTGKEREMAAALFEGWAETMIWSCLQNVMGQVFAVNPAGTAGKVYQAQGAGFADAAAALPVSAMAVLGDFAFMAGEPDERLVAFKPEEHKQNCIIMVPQHEGWVPLIEACYGKDAKRVLRYGTKKNPAVFDSVRRKALKEMAEKKLPERYEMRMMDEELYHVCKSQSWSRDLVAQYEDYASYQNLGLGVCILHDGELAAGASSYSSYQGGIEIEIDTRENYRRQGLAQACGAKLILECLNLNLYPSWDAQNPGSLALARKLGYEPAGSYIAYEIERIERLQPIE